MTARSAPDPEGRRVLLVVDYPGRRDDGHLADLELEKHGFDVRYLLATPFPRKTDARAYAMDLLDRHRPIGGEVAAVVCYCAAAAIGQEVAALLAVASAPVPLILFDGETTDADAVRRQYQVTERQLAERLGDGTAGRRRPVPFDADTLAQRPEQAIEAMRGSLVELGCSALAEDDAEEARLVAESLADFYLDWIAYVVATHHAGWPRWGGDVLHVASRDIANGDWPGARRTRFVRVDVAHAELLADPAAGAAVVDFLVQGVRTEGR